jgi:Putative beta barrel porin-7 (BBP7)
MKKRLLAVLLGLFAVCGSAFAQEPIPVFPPAPGVLPPGPGATIIQQPSAFVPFYEGGVKPATPRATVSVDYLHWWITNGPVNGPLVTTGNPASATAGAIGDPTTRVLFGNSSTDFGGLNGARLTLGYWFGCEEKWGIAASGFALQHRSTTFSAASDATGTPLLALPFTTPNGVQTRQLLSNPLPVANPQTGSVVITSSTQLWGADFNGVWNVYRTCNLSLDLLAGFRYYNLQESMSIDANTTLGVLVRDRAEPFKVAVFDYFGTRNQFYGGQLGARGSYQFGRWSADVLGFVALGDTSHTLTTSGTTTASFNGTPIVTGPGGFYARPSNIGTFHSNNFSVIPQLQAKIGYDITKNLRATIGYDVLYWSNVNRPGDEIDHVLGPQPGTRPAVLDNHSVLWAQGFTAGLEYRW